MGKERVTELLEKLKINQQRELHNTAAIFTVAQIAVNELQQPVADLATKTQLPTFPAPTPLISKAELLKEYGSYKGCRKAAKDQGIQFRRNPSWKDLEIAFSYVGTIQRIVNAYVEVYPSENLAGVNISLKLG